MNLGVLASHRGSTLQALLYAATGGVRALKPRVIISNNSGSGAAERAATHEVPFRHLSGKTHPDPATLDRAIATALEEHGVDVVLLAGYMKKLGPVTLARFRGRILNTHPALLPKFGGKGMYGAHVHRAVLEAGEPVTGVSIHVVDAEYDNGPVIAQAEVPVLPHDSVETLGERVQARERELVVDVLTRIATGSLVLPGSA